MRKTKTILMFLSLFLAVSLLFTTSYSEIIIIIEPDDPVIDPLNNKVPATIDISPSNVFYGRSYTYLTAYIELPTGYNINNVAISTVKISTINAQGNLSIPALASPTSFGDYDGDQIPDIAVNFDYNAIKPLLGVGNMKITINGQLTDQTKFVGEDTIVMSPPLEIISVVSFAPNVFITEAAYNHLSSYIELPAGFDVSQTNLSAVKLVSINGQAVNIPALTAPVTAGDYDSDQVADVLVNFDYNAVKPYLAAGSNVIAVYGELNDLTKFNGSASVAYVAPEEIGCTIALNPNSIQLSNSYQHITAHIELPANYDVNTIDISTVKVTAIGGQAITPIGASSDTSIGDYDSDQVPDLSVKFDYAALKPFLSVGSLVMEISGKLANYTKFFGNAQINVANNTDATVDINPDTININSNGNFITAYIELPAGLNVNEINPAEVKITEINAQAITPLPALDIPTESGDYDSDQIPDLMLKFDRQTLIPLLPMGDVPIKVCGKLNNGAEFSGSDTVKVQNPPPDPDPDPDPTPDPDPQTEPGVLKVTINIIFNFFKFSLDIDIDLPESDAATVQIATYIFAIAWDGNEIFSRTINFQEPITVDTSIDDYDTDKVADLIFISNYNKFKSLLQLRQTLVKLRRIYMKQRHCRQWSIHGDNIWGSIDRRHNNSRRAPRLNPEPAKTVQTEYSFSLNKHLTEKAKITKALLWLKIPDQNKSWRAWMYKAQKTWDELLGKFGNLNYSNLRKGKGYEWDMTEKVQACWDNGLNEITVKIDEKDANKFPVLVVTYEDNNSQEVSVIVKKEDAKKEQNLKSIGEIINLSKENTFSDSETDTPDDTAADSKVITLSYSGMDIKEYDEQALNIYYWNELNYKWEPVADSKVDMETKCITCSIDRKTSYQIMAPKLAQPIANTQIPNHNTPTNSLRQNYPNPFNPATTIEYSIAEDSHVTLKLYNTAGALVAVIVDEFQTAGTHSVYYDAGESLPRGIYFYQLITNNFVNTKRMVVLK